MTNSEAIQWLKWIANPTSENDSDRDYASSCEALSMAINLLSDSGWHNCKDKTRPVVGHDYLCAVISPATNGGAAILQQQVFGYGSFGWSCNGVIVFAWRELPKLPEEVVFPW